MDVSLMRYVISVLNGCYSRGSWLFCIYKGQTQSLATVTLGSKMDNQRYETLEGEKHRSFSL